MKKTNLEGKSFNAQEELLSLLKKKFPEVFTDGKIDAQKLKLTLGENVEVDNERYSMSWAGKSDCFRIIQEPTTATLKPARDESVNFDDTENLFIEGDNLEVLKILQKSYYGKVKMIYIDPPYNTGNDFIYNDDFKQKKAEYELEAGIKDVDGNLRVDGLHKNTKDRGHYHSDWMNMIYPRLFLARNLLRRDGVIFVSIDDNEVKNLRIILDEVFGEENFLAQITWEKVHTRKNSTKFFSVSHEYIVCYARHKEEWDRILLPREDDSSYKNPDNHPKGPWKLDPITAHNEYSAEYTITKPNGVVLTRPQGRYWAFSEDTISQKINNNEIVWGRKTLIQ